MQIPTSAETLRPASTVLAVYAPFGTDPVLSTYPDGQSQGISEHPLLGHLQRVAATGVAVVALVDLTDRGTFQVDIPAGRPSAMTIESHGKMDMLAPQTLTALLLRAHAAAPRAQVVLTLEGHGAGYLPDLDSRGLGARNVSGDGRVQWRVGFVQDESLLNAPYREDGEPLVQRGAPVLPVPNPTSPTTNLAMSTWGMGEGLAAAIQAGMRKVAVVHLNNCFNMAIEVLHTVAPHAGCATGYLNYNFFTAGQAYPAVFERLRAAGEATPLDLARWFAEENHAVLDAAGHEPTVAGTIDLARMHGIVEALDDLADALLAALRTASSTERPQVVCKIRKAIIAAQQFDTTFDFDLDVPDELTDLDSFAVELLAFDFEPAPVRPAARALHELLRGIKQYGDVGSPWNAPGQVFDFSSPDLAMGIFLPDPLLKGLWNWRAQYYLDVNPDPSRALVQRHIIEFLKVTDWVDFLIEFHRETPFVGLLPALIPDMPVLHAPRDPRRPRRCVRVSPQPIDHESSRPAEGSAPGAR